MAPVGKPHGWTRTYSGFKLDFDAPEEALARGEINVEDIAYSLSNVARFGGHARRNGNNIYSVGDHSLRVARLLTGDDRLFGLLHDAAEAFMGDMVSPRKDRFPGWRDIEARWERSILLALHPDPSKVDERMKRRVKTVDLLVLGRELIDLMPHGAEDAESIGYMDSRRPSDLGVIVPRSPDSVFYDFLDMYDMLEGSTW